MVAIAYSCLRVAQRPQANDNRRPWLSSARCKHEQLVSCLQWSAHRGFARDSISAPSTERRVCFVASEIYNSCLKNRDLVRYIMRLASPAGPHRPHSFHSTPTSHTSSDATTLLSSSMCYTIITYTDFSCEHRIQSGRHHVDCNDRKCRFSRFHDPEPHNCSATCRQTLQPEQGLVMDTSTGVCPECAATQSNGVNGVNGH